MAYRTYNNDEIGIQRRYKTTIEEQKKSKDRLAWIASSQEKEMKNDWKDILDLIEEYRYLSEHVPRNYKACLELEKRLDKAAEEYAKSKIYIQLT